MSAITRISPEETRQRVEAGKALLVCAYTDYAKFTRYHLDGAIAFSDLHAREAALSREQEIIFYCN